ncbi:NAD(P)-dependent oxidoreductase [Deinococcus yavapaiensis]|uniref:Phosphoglycerate dehydrogenase-like enzyme n=1 Tax=Deinococcus yavapaiensis KR-236 TaxID=694435 RepID=A0A318SBE0_9DEIO|nr:NAD(P)-dependent oxidoreductase [Deinococcus yavapaiensis]PYE56368.1 phosphoglycerate dehydrogenase-like enzyme [Deinococcus yavapaiensis KR-236]
MIRDKNVLVRVLIPSEFSALSLPDVELLQYNADSDLPDADGLVTWGFPRFVREHALTLPSLRWALTLTAGVDNILPDFPPHLRLFNASQLHAEAVAQHALALLLAGARGLHAARDFQRERTWARSGIFSGGNVGGGLTTLRGKHVVIWGHGTIGRSLEAMLAPLGANVTGLRSSATREQLDEALRTADVLVLLVPLTEKTRGLVNADVLARLKPSAWFANLGRGELVVQDDLVAALESRRIGLALLDVTTPEPLPETSPLWTLPNVVLTPHVAAATNDLAERGAEFTRSFLERFTRGLPLENEVSRDKGY